MAGNKSLNAAAAAKQDEFYTQLTDIEKELRHYRRHFAGKTVLCNCDDPFESNFFKYFVLNFNRLGLKKLVATCYAGSPIVYTQMNLFGEPEEVVQAEREKKPYKVEVTQVYDATGDALNKTGYKTRRGKPFVISTVQSIWNNEKTYRGMYHYGKDGEWVQGQHEPILTD